MNLKDLQKNWNNFGKKDPLWAILTVEAKKGNRWTPEEFFETGRDEIEQLMEHMRGLGLTVRRNRALDFGCGVGRLTQALAKYFQEVIGVDIAPSMLTGARKYNRYGEQCRYVLNERDDLRIFDNNYFDLIYSNIVLHHMRPEYCKAYLKEFLRILTHGGYLVFYMPSRVLKEWVPPPPEPPSPNLLPTIKRLIKRSIPKPLLNMYVKIRYESAPVMESYCLKKDEVEAYLREYGGEVLDTTRDVTTIPNREGYRYTVTKH
ncbi:MAG TPA: methyltransferase domain-containing protein [Nitrospira sp.]|nr:methyltransferase domain-containing protein [Nitrospira sp.]